MNPKSERQYNNIYMVTGEPDYQEKSWCKLPYNDIMGFEKTIVLLRSIYSMIGCMKYKM